MCKTPTPLVSNIQNLKPASHYAIFSSDADYFKVGRFLMVGRLCLLVFTSGDSVLENRRPYFR